MNKKIVLVIFLAMVVLTISQVEATATISIDVNPSFTLGETIQFNYNLVSNTNEQVNYSLSIECPNAPIPFVDMKTAELQSNTPVTGTYGDVIIDETIEPQTCTAFVSITEPYGLTETKEFKIIANPSFEFKLESCKDQSCSEKSKIFVKDEKIYLSYNSETSNPDITAVLTYPDKKTNQIALPASITASQIGTYKLEATASKQGYKTISTSEQFGVIERRVNIGYTTAPNDYVSENQVDDEFIDSTISTPGDQESSVTGNDIGKYIFIGFIFIILMIIIVVIIFFRRRDYKEE